MNLKKTVLSLFAATAIVGSMLAPVAAQVPTPKNENTHSTVTEGGGFTFSFGGGGHGGVLFVDAVVSSPLGDTVELSGANHRVMSVSDTRTSSPGYTLQMTATNLEHSGFATNGFYIDKSYLSVRNGGGNGPVGVHSSCLWNGALATPDGAVVGNNTYQVHTWTLGSTYTPIGDGTQLFTAGEGRGCDFGRGGFQYNMGWQLALPGGIATGTYQGSVTISQVTAPLPQ